MVEWKSDLLIMGGIALACILIFVAVFVPVVCFSSPDCSSLIEFQEAKVIAVGSPVEHSGLFSGASYSVVYLDSGHVLPIPRGEMHLYRVGQTYDMRLVQFRSGAWTPDRRGECECYLIESNR